MGRVQTTKKVKIIGTQQYLNTSTGELIETVVTNVEERDFNFTKVWMRNFISTLELVGNAKSKVAFWVIDNITRDNMLPFTYRQISDSTGVSLDTVTKTMNALQEAQFLRRLNQGCYIVNPDIVFKGSRSGRLNALTQFQAANAAPPEKLTLEQRFANLTQTIRKLTEEADKLSAEINAQNKKNAPENVPGGTQGVAAS